ncbi:MAG: hypothetical protein J0H51_08730 [Rhizobiales bacterium]|nr:hypothetical protein [Hyphomicrobiales bacterium]MBN9001077.1 hypothetical protein [Hyphomicrobiales bacterium]
MPLILKNYQFVSFVMLRCGETLLDAAYARITFNPARHEATNISIDSKVSTVKGSIATS